MRVFSIGADDSFTEYESRQFEAEHEEAVLQKWLEANPRRDPGGWRTSDHRARSPDRPRRLHRPTRPGPPGERCGRGTEKRPNTEDTIAQALEYASYAERLDADALERILRAYEQDDSLSLADQHRKCFDLDEVEAVAFNKDQRLVIVGQTLYTNFHHGSGFPKTCGPEQRS